MSQTDMSFSHVMNPAGATVSRGREITVSSPGPVDFFIDPADGRTVANAPFVYDEQSGDFTLSAVVTPQFAATFDAGALFVWFNETTWFKLAFEYTDMGFPAVVSVVTHGYSDDANGQRLDLPSVELMVARRENLWSLHWREPGKAPWHMKRYLRLGEPGQTARVGLVVQSPTGTGCSATFSDIRTGTPPENMRSVG